MLYIRVAACDLPENVFSRGKVNLKALIGSFAGLVVFSLIVTLNYYGWKRWKLAKSSAADDGFDATMLTIFAYKELQIATRNFSEKLGSGGFGSV